MTGEGVDFFGIEDGRAEVVDAVTEGAVDAIFDAVSARIGLVHARSRLEVTQVVSPLRVARRSMQKGTIVAVGADARRLVVVGAVDVRGIADMKREG